MRVAIALAILAGVVAGCSGGGRPPVASPPEAVRPTVKITVQRSEPTPEPLLDARCNQLVELVAAGDHKPAVDLMSQLETENRVCPVEIEAAAEASRLTLLRADEMVLSSTARKRDGDLAGAKEDLRAALEIYPRYFWAAKLLRDLGESRPALAEAPVAAADEPVTSEPVAGGEATRPDLHAVADSDVEMIRELIAEQNLELARLAEQQGNLPAASRWIQQAIKAEPGDAGLKKGIVEYARLLGLKFFSAGELTPARELWSQAVRLDQSDPRLNEYLRQVEERLQNLDQIRKNDG